MNYGKCPGDPVILSSRVTVKKFLNHLVTDKGFHILYHLRGLVTVENGVVIDHYELMTGGGEYDDLFFNLHHDSDSWFPPEGYLFVPEIELIPLNLPGYEQIYTKERELLVDGKFIFQDTNAGNWEDDMRFFGQLPPLERYLYHSYGDDDFMENFPFPLIDEILDNLDIEISPVMKDWIISTIKPRENRPLISGKC